MMARLAAELRERKRKRLEMMKPLCLLRGSELKVKDGLFVSRECRVNAATTSHSCCTREHVEPRPSASRHLLMACLRL